VTEHGVFAMTPLITAYFTHIFFFCVSHLDRIR
jgi:hypothetical protein